MSRFVLFVTLAIALTACALPSNDSPAMSQNSAPEKLRIATFNVSLYGIDSGLVIERLRGGQDAQARSLAAIIQRVRPDILLLNEFDFDPQGQLADVFQNQYLAIDQHGDAAINYPYRFFAPVNTGVQSGFDLDRNGTVGGDGRSRGNDAWGFGLHPGQYGMLVLSRYPIDLEQTRTFQKFRWKNLPEAKRPIDPVSNQPFYSDDIWAQFPLSSKSHWDVPVRVSGKTIHVLAAHPTPPVFDGPEDRNGMRNADEIRFWAEYLNDPNANWLCDDQGRCGGLYADAAFVIVGDLNADPADGDGYPGAIDALLRHPRVAQSEFPSSAGAVESALKYPAVNASHNSPPQFDTGHYEQAPGNLHLDYVLESRNLVKHDSGVFWPTESEPESPWLAASDHRLVWLDIELNRN